MPARDMQPSVTSLIRRLRSGDSSALHELMPVVYGELHNVALAYLRQERHNHTLQPTALVNEVYLRLIGGRHPDYADRTHFLGVAASLMRQILVDHARSRNAVKRGGPGLIVPMDDNVGVVAAPRETTVIALHEALDALAQTDPEKARIVELRFFGGMTAEEISVFLDESVHRVRREMRVALAWLHREVSR